VAEVGRPVIAIVVAPAAEPAAHRVTRAVQPVAVVVVAPVASHRSPPRFRLADPSDPCSIGGPVEVAIRGPPSTTEVIVQSPVRSMPIVSRPASRGSSKVREIPTQLLCGTAQTWRETTPFDSRTRPPDFAR